MQNSNTVTGSAHSDAPAHDLGPLAWVLEELRKSLDTANKALRRYVRDAELARGSDLETVDTGQLRISRQQLHQATGALEMVGFTQPALLLQSMEAVVQKFVQKPESCTDEAVSKIERTSYALTGYLETVLAGKPHNALALFVQYAQTQELAGATRTHPADLWAFPWRWVGINDTGATAVELNADTRALFDTSALQVMKVADAIAANQLSQLSAGIAATGGLQQAKQFTTFWRIAAAFFQSIGSGSLVADIYAKRTVSRILMQLAMHVKGDMAVSDRLAQDLLFFCAQAKPKGDVPLLTAARAAYGLASQAAFDYTKSPFGQFDPVILAQARKRIVAAKESWSALTAGEMIKTKAVEDHFGLIGQSIAKLLPAGLPLSTALVGCVETVAKSGKPPEPTMAMEVATAVLYLDAGFQDFDPNDHLFSQRLELLAQRVDQSRQGAPTQALEPWMEELYRRVSDKQTMGSVVGELKIALADVERSLDQFFRDTQNKSVLVNVPTGLMQMRGVLSVLGLDHASQAVAKMRDSVEQILVTEVDDSHARETGTFDRLGNNLGALGFLIDMLSYQPVLAKKLFVFDAVTNELKPLMGRTKAVIPHEDEAPEIIIPADTATQSAAFANTVVLPAMVPAKMPEMAIPVAVVAGAASAVALANVAPAAVAPVTPPAVAPALDLSDDDAEILDIFLEEAREVIHNGRASLDILKATPSNQAELTSLRRVFHTLKGSSRMVGLTAFGDAGWALEQLYNSWLADQKGATSQLCDVTGQSLTGLSQWVEDIAKRSDQSWSAAPFIATADALRLEGRLAPLVLDNLTFMPTEVLAPIVPAAQEPEEFNFDLVLDLPMSTDNVAPIEPAKEVALSDSEFDLSFDLDLGEQALQPVAAFAPETNTLTNTDHLSTVVLDIPPSKDGVDLIDEDEMAAFERALKEGMQTASAPLQVSNTSFSATEIMAPPGTSSFVSQVAALQAVLDRGSVQQVSALQNSEQSAADKAMHTADFGSMATQPMSFEPLVKKVAPQEPEDLGFDLGDFSKPAPMAVPAAVADAAIGNTATQPKIDTAEKPSPTLLATAAAGLGALAAGSAAIAGMDRIQSMPAPLSGNEDQFKAIGPLRINLPLYNMYLNEADEWSRRLAVNLTEWSLEKGQPIPNDAVSFSHSLAGTSATVGFSAMSVLARSLENALLHLQTIDESQSYDLHQHASVLLQGAEEIRRLLHQFAAGILKEPLPQVIQALDQCLLAAPLVPEPVEVIQTPHNLLEPEPVTDEQSPQVEQYASITVTDSDSLLEFFDQKISDKTPESHIIPAQAAPDLIADAVQFSPIVAPISGFGQLPAATVTVIAAVAAGTAVAATQNQFVAKPLTVVAAPAEVIPQTLTVVQRLQTEQEAEEEIDLVDVIDPDLFPIFEEEAAELLPKMGTALRQWAATPSNVSAREEVLRGLHTLKGSARLAGALRLGELAHRMESSIEHVPEHEAQTAQLEPLLGVLDGLQANFDRLRLPPAAEPTVTASVSMPLAAVPVPAAAPTALDAPGITSTVSTLAAKASDTSFATGNTITAPDLQQMPTAAGLTQTVQTQRVGANQTVRVRTQLLDRMVNQAGEVIITRSRLEAELGQLRGSMVELTGNLDKLRQQLRDIEVQSESQMQSRMALAKESEQSFDPLEFDRFTRVQELTRMMAESVNDVATVQRNIQRTVEATEDDLTAQARQTRELQRDLLRTRMVEFEGISDRLYRVVRQASKDAGKQVKLDITGGSIEMDRGVLDRMTPAFEHLLRNCVAHGIEEAQARVAAGKDASGQITISLHQEGNDVSVEFRDDGAGLNLPRIRERAISQGLITQGQTLADGDAANLIFTSGFTTAAKITELSGRGIGMDVVRSEITALGGRIETSTTAGKGTNFKLVLPLTTAVTQVVMVRVGSLAFGVPANLIETVRRTPTKELEPAYNTGSYFYGGENLPFFWAGALLQHSPASTDAPGKTIPLLVFKSAAQRIVAHVDEVLGNQEVVVKNLGPQLARLPGLAGMSVLASGAVALIYNPVALAAVYGVQARAYSADKAESHVLSQGAITDVQPRDLSGNAAPVVPLVPANPSPVPANEIPLILVVDDSITVRRVTQRLLQREGYRVSLAADGLQALERLAEAELPSMILSDIEMPRMDGFDLARNIKADPRLAQLPIVMITSRIAEKHKEHAIKLGVNHYLGKPFSEEELLSLVRRYTSHEIEA